MCCLIIINLYFLIFKKNRTSPFCRTLGLHYNLYESLARPLGLYYNLTRPLGLHYNHYVSPSVRGQLHKCSENVHHGSCTLPDYCQLTLISNHHVHMGKKPYNILCTTLYAWLRTKHNQFCKISFLEKSKGDPLNDVKVKTSFPNYSWTEDLSLIQCRDN